MQPHTTIIFGFRFCDFRVTLLKIQQALASKRSLRLALVLLVSTLPLTAGEMNLTNQHNRIQEALARRNYSQAIALLEEVRQTTPALYSANNYEYLHARLAESTGDTATAQRLYQAVFDRSGLLAPFALRHLADMAHQRADFKTEQTLLQRLTGLFPASPATRGARKRLAESYELSGNFAAAANIYQAIAGSDRDLLGNLGLALRKAGEPAEARAVFQRLWAGGRDDQGLLAIENLDEIGPAATTEAEHLARGRLYLANRHSEGAIRHFTAIVNEFPASKAMPEVLYGIGRAHYIAERWDDAITWYKRAHQEFPLHDKGELGFYQSGHALQNAGRTRAAIAQYEAFLQEYPKSEYAGGAHLNAIDTLRLAGDNKEALAWCDRAQRRFPAEITSVTALFQQAKIQLSQNQYQSALSTFTLLRNQNLSRRGPGSTNFNEVAFMRAFCIEQLGLFQQAVEEYLAMPDERNRYYGQRATERLLQLRSNPTALPLLETRLKSYLGDARTAFQSGNLTSAKNAAQQALRLTDNATLRNELFDILTNCYKKLPEYSRAWNYRLLPAGRPLKTEAEGAGRTTVADELCFLGLFDEGAGELNLSRTASDSAEDWNFSTAVYANRGSQSWKAYDYGDRVFGGLPADFRLELMPREVAELLYPAPYRDALTQSARPRRVDPRLLLAISRQESRFKPWVKSPAAARGLFQFIDATADQLAQELKLTHFTRDDLYEPKTAVLFGSQYVASLFKQFPSHPQAVTASYNGGESSVKRWLQRASSREVDRFPIEVGYAETKDYVFIVMSNYRCYQQLYRQDLAPNEF
ncbi:MAG: tetratricopeptide repeat protein [Blastocatellia bacterium]|nr:tetratricopeptide repeat protein [Blastocatellia bacterium]